MRPTPLEAMVLASIRDYPGSYAKEVAQDIEERFPYHFGVSRVSFTLRSLQSRGMVVRYFEVRVFNRNGIRLPLYHITDRGLARLNELIEEQYLTLRVLRGQWVYRRRSRARN